ncbi:hypothetical protein Tco_0097304 [Tanacetum coccineum]
MNMGLWYSKDTNIALTAYADADRKSTSGSAKFLGDRLYPVGRNVYIRDLGFDFLKGINWVLRVFGRYTTRLLRASILILTRLEESLESTQERIGGSGEAMEASKRRRSMLDYRIQQLSKFQDVSNDEENKDGENKADAEVVEKQAGNEQQV